MAGQQHSDASICSRSVTAQHPRCLRMQAHARCLRVQGVLLQQSRRNLAVPACVYLSMKCRAFGTLWSPRCTTAEPTQPPSRCWQRHKMLWMALLTRGAACTRFSPWPACNGRAAVQVGAISGYHESVALPVACTTCTKCPAPIQHSATALNPVENPKTAPVLLRR